MQRLQSRPQLSEHEGRVEFLKALAELAGYSVSLPCLPGGLIPDVLKFSPISRGLFIGDAKNTESPFDQRTQVRLSHYLFSLAIYLRRTNSHGVFAICFGKRTQEDAWE